MSKLGSRPRGAWAKVCAVFKLLLCLLAAKSAAASQEPEVFAEDGTLPGVVVYPPRDRSAPRPVTVMLHGMCSEPERTCRYFAETVTQSSWLVCPRASERCSGGGSTWPQKGFEASIETAVGRAISAHAEEIDEHAGRTLIGFSLGAFRALALAQNADGTYPRVMLIGAKIQPEIGKLRGAGVTHLLLAAGEFDMMHDHMLGRARVLTRSGYPVEFQSLGRVGHAFPENFPDLLSQALAYLGAR